MSEVDVNKPITNPSLKEAMQTYHEEKNADTLNAMINELMAAHFLMPAIIDTKETPDINGVVTLSKDTSLEFPTLSTQDNDLYFMAFTDWQELKKWRDQENQQTVIMTFDDYAALILREESDIQGFVINPMGENMNFVRELIAHLKEQKELMEKGYAEHTAKKEESVSYGEPKEYPTDLVAAVSKHMKKAKEIKAGYLQLLTRDGEESFLIVVDFDGDLESIFKGIAEVIQPYVQGKHVDLLPIHSDFAMQIVQKVEPFYKKMFYKKPVQKEANIAIIEDTFGLANDGCVLGCTMKNGKLQVNDRVEVLDEEGNTVFECVIAGIEYGPHNAVKEADSKALGEYGSHFAFMIENRIKEEFHKGYCLVKK